ncbi:MAG TPA: trypsin-like peptidase domain-containing protein [Acidimicrobiia bacterium]|nr:trypsin-like peptidase domain-containing protein [Acidimicrobiia bacterium]
MAELPFPPPTFPSADTPAPGPSSALPPWPPQEQPSGRRGRRRSRDVLVGALAGGLVGALAAGGLALAFDDGSSTTNVVSSGAVPVVSRPSSTVEGGTDIASIIEKAEPAIVAITTDDGPGSGTGGAGTGVVITDDGFVVTNNHVVEGASTIEVAFTNGEIEGATIVGRDPSNDLAVLKVARTGLPAVELGDSDQIQVGDEVVAIGNALALEGGLSVTRGIISGTDRTVDTNVGSSLVGMLQTDAAINPGNSGGPLLDAQGRVIGINTAIANPASAQNVGFAIPISKASPIIEDLRLGRKGAFLGVSTETVTPARAREAGLAVSTGAIVVQVTPGSPAEDAGVEVGDVIVAIGDTPVDTTADVQTAVRENRPGDTVKVIVDRDGERVTIEAVLAERPDAG